MENIIVRLMRFLAKKIYKILAIKMYRSKFLHLPTHPLTYFIRQNRCVTNESQNNILTALFNAARRLQGGRFKHIIVPFNDEKPNYVYVSETELLGYL